MGARLRGDEDKSGSNYTVERTIIVKPFTIYRVTLFVTLVE